MVVHFCGYHATLLVLRSTLIFSKASSIFIIEPSSRRWSMVRSAAAHRKADGTVFDKNHSSSASSSRCRGMRLFVSCTHGAPANCRMCDAGVSRTSEEDPGIAIAPKQTAPKQTAPTRRELMSNGRKHGMQ